MVEREPAGGEDLVVARVRALLDLAAQHRLKELAVEAADFRFHFKAQPPTVASLASAPLPVSDEPTAAATEVVADTGSLITAPMIGTFYTAPAPDEPAFVSVGDTIEPGQTIAIIEAMKIMNEIQSDLRGVLVEILVRNGQGVEFGQPLFRLRTA